MMLTLIVLYIVLSVLWHMFLGCLSFISSMNNARILYNEVNRILKDGAK